MLIKLPRVWYEIYETNRKNIHYQIQRAFTVIKNSNSKFKFALLHETGNSFGSVKKVMGVLQFVNKGSIVNALEKFYIHLEAKKNSQINDKSPFGHSKVFDTVVQRDCSRYRP
jgi:hypothetical protein